MMIVPVRMKPVSNVIATKGETTKEEQEVKLQEESNSLFCYVTW